MDFLCHNCTKPLKSTELDSHLCGNCLKSELKQSRHKRSRRFVNNLISVILSVILITAYLILTLYGETIEEKKAYIESATQKNKPINKYKSPPKKFKN